MLGGWLLIGVDDDGKVVGYEPPGTGDLQDYIRDLLRAQVDPLPPFAAVSVPVGEHKIGVVRVAESSDTPHITSEGVIYVRNAGGKQRVTDHRDILEMARRGEQARDRAAERQYGLSLIREAMTTPRQIVGEREDDAATRPLLQWIVRGAPYTVTGAFADRALSVAAAELAEAQVTSLAAEPAAGPFSVGVSVEPRARGLYCVGGRRHPQPRHADIAIDAGGVVAARIAWRRAEEHSILLRFLAEDALCGPIRAVADTLGALDGYGRAVVGLELRGALDILVEWDPRRIGVLDATALTQPRQHFYVGGDLAVPGSDDDVRELADLWTREIARAAGLPLWEPGPESTPPDDETR
jgi:hypothetical protein